MKRRSDPRDFERLREKIIGLGERSIRKSYYPKLQEQLHELKRFRTLLDQSSDAIFLLAAPSGRFIDLNESACVMLVYSRQQLLALSLENVADPDLLEPVHELLQRRETGEHCCLTHEMVLIKSTGENFPVEISIRLVAFGGSVYAVAAARDITARRKAFETLRLMQFSVDHASVSAFLVNNEGRLLYVNEQTCTSLGYTGDELLRMSVFDLNPGLTASRWKYIWARVIEERGLHIETVHRRKDGSEMPVAVSASYIAFGGTEYSWAFGLDITERKRMEDSLRISEARFRNLFEQSPLSMQILAPDGRTLEVNRAFEVLWGFTIEALKEYSILRDEQLESKGLMPFIRKAFHGQATEIPTAQYDPSEIGLSGQPRWVKAFLYPVKAGDGSVHEVVLIHVDVSEMVKAENALRESEESLKQAYAGLEVKVRERTAELMKANADLQNQIEERRKAESTIREEQAFRQAIEDSMLAGIVGIDLDGIQTHVNPAFCKLTGWRADELIGTRPPFPYWPPEEEDTINKAFQDTIAGQGQSYELRFMRKTGERFDAQVLISPLTDSRGRVIGRLASVSDISRHKKDEQDLRRVNQKLKSVLDSITEAYYSLDSEWRIVEINKEAEKLLGPAREILGQVYWKKFSQNIGSEIERQYRRAAAEGHPVHFEARSAVTNRWYEFHAYPRDRVLEVYFRDISNRKRMEESIRHMAQHDPLTSLPNRRLFIDILNVELAEARRHKTKLAVLFLDLDRFKEINDTLGHDTGDRLLIEVARRFRATIRQSDTVARIGGDEFNMVLTDVARAEDVSEIAVKIVKSLEPPVKINSHDLHVSTSVGISVFPDDGRETDSLLRYADIAMYHAKESGRNTFRFYNPSINVRSIEKMKLESALRQTIPRGELAVHYQPQVDIKTGKIAFAEALVRWNHPERGMLAPQDFLPLAEETGFITTIDEWVLRTVCTQAVSWKKSGYDSFCVSVNLSSRQFQSPDLVKMVSSALSETGMSPNCLDIEVTENTAMANIEQTASRLRELTQMGVHISIDDFGTGYSSLNYLKKLPIERIKIDKSFVRDIAKDQDDRAIISAVTSMARQMGIRTVAEGVETEEQLAFVREAGCDEVQGFLVSRPLKPEDFKVAGAQ